jgi:hypothetical protein
MKYLMLGLILMTISVLADQFAVTNDGKTVLLKDDGTWEYTEEGARIAAEERKEFWTNVAINVAKVLGVIAALITLRFIIRTIGKGVGIKEEKLFLRLNNPHNLEHKNQFLYLLF